MVMDYFRWCRKHPIWTIVTLVIVVGSLLITIPMLFKSTTYVGEVQVVQQALIVVDKALLQAYPEFSAISKPEAVDIRYGEEGEQIYATVSLREGEGREFYFVQYFERNHKTKEMNDYRMANFTVIVLHHEQGSQLVYVVKEKRFYSGVEYARKLLGVPLNNAQLVQSPDGSEIIVISVECTECDEEKAKQVLMPADSV